MTGEIAGIRVTMPDTGTRVAIDLEVTIRPSELDVCPYAIYEFTDSPRLSAADVTAIMAGAAAAESEFGGTLLLQNELQQGEGFERLLLRDPVFDKGAFETTIVTIACPGAGEDSEFKFLAFTYCWDEGSRPPRHGPKLEFIDVELQP